MDFDRFVALAVPFRVVAELNLVFFYVGSLELGPEKLALRFTT